MTVLSHGHFSPMTRSRLIIYFSIFQLNLICRTGVGLPTIRTGTLPIRVNDYRYLVIFLQFAQGTVVPGNLQAYSLRMHWLLLLIVFINQ